MTTIQHNIPDAQALHLAAARGFVRSGLGKSFSARLGPCPEAFAGHMDLLLRHRADVHVILSVLEKGDSTEHRTLMVMAGLQQDQAGEELLRSSRGLAKRMPVHGQHFLKWKAVLYSQKNAAYFLLVKKADVNARNLKAILSPSCRAGLLCHLDRAPV